MSCALFLLAALGYWASLKALLHHLPSLLIVLAGPLR